MQNTRSGLKLLDTAFTLECPGKYNGPKLPKDFTARTIFIDGRILRLIPVLKESLTELCGNDFTISSNLVLPGLPYNELYYVDILLTSPQLAHESEVNSTLRSMINNKLHIGNTNVDESIKHVAILINIPEHFSSDGQHLIGSQVMRKRHLEAIGVKVINVTHLKLCQLRVHPKLVIEYLKEKLRDADVWSSKS